VLACTAALPALGTGCSESPVEVELTSEELAGNDVVIPIDGPVYRYLLSTVNADSLLRLMRRDGVPVTEALLPLEDLCADPLGPRFTVLLSREFEEITTFHFERGSGIRACTTRVRRYVWTS
jgi:hypothetical protein